MLFLILNIIELRSFVIWFTVTKQKCVKVLKKKLVNNKTSANGIFRKKM